MGGPLLSQKESQMSFAKTYEQAKRDFKPMRRSTIKSSKPMKRTRMKQSRISPEDKAWCEAVLERDGHRCRWVDPRTDFRCSEAGKHVQAHHINERSQRPDLVHDVDNGAAICPFHHDYAHHSVRGRKEAQAQGLLSTAAKYEFRDR